MERQTAVTNPEYARLAGFLREFARERDWEQSHTPNNLVMAGDGFL